MSNWIEDALADAGKSPTGQAQGGTTQACPLSQPPFILVRAVRADTGEPIGGADVKLEGPTPGSKRTATGTGVSVFDPVKPGGYRLNASLSGSQAELFEPPAPAQLSVTADGFSIQIVLFTPLAKLKVRIFTTGDGSPPRPAAVAGVTVRASLQGGRGPRQRETDAAGVADFGPVPAGNGRIEVQTSAAFPGRFSPVPSTSILLEATRELIVPIELDEPLDLEVVPSLEEEDELAFSDHSEEEDEMTFEWIVTDPHAAEPRPPSASP